MSRGPIGRNDEIRCTFVQDGDEGSWSSHSFGHAATLVFRCIFIPDGDGGPTPGYPWIEVGWMTLDPEQTATSEIAQRAVRPDSLPGQRVDDPPAERAEDDDTAETSRTGHSNPDIGLAVEAWNALPHPRTTVAALDSASVSNPLVTSLAREQRTRERCNRTCGIE